MTQKTKIEVSLGYALSECYHKNEMDSFIFSITKADHR